MAEFTKGPWGVTESLDHNDNPCVTVTGHDDETIYEIVAADAKDRANARLIAAAPELYEALESIAKRENLMFAECSDAEDIIATAKAALAKAKGEA